MDIVADVQFFKDKKNSFVPKEIALVSLKGDFSAHWIVSAVQRIESLPSEARKDNNWLSRHKHGLDYFDGSVTLKALYRTLSDIFKCVEKIYVRGKEKWLLFHKISTREVINLEYDKDCPSFENLPWSDKYCLNHAIKTNYLQFSCALNRACRLKSYLLSQSQTLNKNLELNSPLQFYNEQSTNSELSITDALAYCRCVPCGPNSTDVDETDCFHIQHR